MGEGARSQGFADSFRLAGTVFFVELGGGPSETSVSYGRLTQHTRWRTPGKAGVKTAFDHEIKRLNPRDTEWFLKFIDVLTLLFASTLIVSNDFKWLKWFRIIHMLSGFMVISSILNIF